MSLPTQYSKGAKGKQERERDELREAITALVFGCVAIAASAEHRKASIVQEIIEIIGLWMAQGKRTRDYSLGVTRNYGDAHVNGIMEAQPGVAPAPRGKPPHPKAYIQMAFTNAIAAEVLYLKRVGQSAAAGAEREPGT